MHAKLFSAISTCGIPWHQQMKALTKVCITLVTFSKQWCKGLQDGSHWRLRRDQDSNWWCALREIVRTMLTLAQLATQRQNKAFFLWESLFQKCPQYKYPECNALQILVQYINATILGCLCASTTKFSMSYLSTVILPQHLYYLLGRLSRTASH